MHKVRLGYDLGSADDDPRALHHPLMAMLEAIHATGSISAAARRLGQSYRHVWGELKRWEAELEHPLVIWAKGRPARLSPFGAKLLWAERRVLARLAPQLEALRSELERVFDVAFDDRARVLPMYASHDEALPRLRDWAARHHALHLDIQFTGSVDALAALNDGRCLVAGFHALVRAPLGSPTARVYRPMLRPGVHKLIGFAERTQGLIVAAGNPLGIAALDDLVRPGVRFVNRQRGTGTRVVLEELLAAAGIAGERIDGYERTEPSHLAVAECVASGRADAAFGIEAAARARGLDFLALAQEQYFLVTRAEDLSHPHVQALLEVLKRDEWLATLAAIPGYAPERSGDVLSLREVLPWWHYRTPKRRSTAP